MSISALLALTLATATALPDGVAADKGVFVTSAGAPLYVYKMDTMVGMSHCIGRCAEAWPPLLAGKAAKPVGDWTLIGREDGAQQWAFRNHPVYTAALSAADLQGALGPDGAWTPARPEAAPLIDAMAAAKGGPGIHKRVVGVVLYPGFEVLDVFGPVEMWANVPDLKVVMIAQAKGPVRSAQGVTVQADYGFDDAPKLDVVMVPGGRGTFTELKNPTFLNYLVKADHESEFTTSVCTGSALLAKAGLLKGRRATSNKKFFSLAVEQDQSVSWAKSARWVEDGKFITSSGVSAGTDMALGLLSRIYGPAATRMLAQTLEYQWSEDPKNDPFAIK